MNTPRAVRTAAGEWVGGFWGPVMFERLLVQVFGGGLFLGAVGNDNTTGALLF